MQVTAVNDFISHAVIGGNETVEFRISDSPEFFQILSSTLYKDQKLAVIRETLCNAWDAHIASGRTDKAVIVTVDSHKLVIRDFGTGIHKDQMGPTYLTYGNSTKKNDGEQTGGFGLGCKSPFAYTDHFEVSSFHEGMKTIYAISKSSAEHNGKPGCTPIVSFPTTETGLEVSINLANIGDGLRFKELVQRIARNGEMKVELNGELIKTLPFSKMESNYLITRIPLGDNQNGAINIRYGNVIYPVDSEKGYLADYNMVKDFINDLHTDWSSGYYRLVLQAPPHSISVTPSRESLSMQEHTVKTIQKLLAGFIEVIHRQVPQNAQGVLDKQILWAKTEGMVGELLNNNRSMPGLSTLNQEKSQSHLLGLDDLTTQYTRKRYPKKPGFFQADLMKRLDTVKSMNFGKRGHIDELKSFIGQPVSRTTPKPHDWYKQRILRPLVRDLQASPVMDPKRLYVRDANYTGKNNGLIQADMYDRHSFSSYMPILRNIVVLTHAQTTLSERVTGFPEFKKLGSPNEIFVYLAPYAKTKVQEMRDFWTQRGFILLDLTVEQPWDKPKKVRAKPLVPLPKREKVVGYPSLAGVTFPGRQMRVDNCFEQGAPRVEDPLFYVHVTPSRAVSRFFELDSFKNTAAQDIVRLFGDVCAVVKTQPQADALKEQGLLRLEEYVLSHVIHEITHSPNFLAYWPDSIERALGNKTLDMTYQSHKVELETLFRIPEVRSAAGLSNTLTDDDRTILSLWRHICERSTFRYSKLSYSMSWNEARDFLESQPVSIAAREVARAGSQYGPLSILDASNVRRMLRDPPDSADMVIGIIKTLLNT